MFLSLWYYIKGYVIVEVSGYTLSKLIDLAVRNGIIMWRVRHKDDKIYMCTTIKGFKKLKPYARKARCRFCIIEKKGIPFITFKYRKRWLFSIGSLLFVLGLYILCSFVWLVDITGTERLETSQVAETLKEAGFTTGKFKASLDLRQAEELLMEKHKEITWVGIAFEGTKMLVQVAEAEPKPDIHSEGAPSHLVAKRDALVKKVVTDRGMPIVIKGDTVRKGEVLISGQIPLKTEDESYLYTEAKGKVVAQTGYSLKASLPLVAPVKKYSDEVAKSYSIKLFETKIPLFVSNKTFNQYDTLVTINQLRLTDLFPLPFYFEKHEKIGYQLVYKEVDEQELKDKLLGSLHDELRQHLEKNAIILKQEIIYKKTTEHMTAVLNVIAEEEIAKSIPITQTEPIQEDTKRSQ